LTKTTNPKSDNKVFPQNQRGKARLDLMAIPGKSNAYAMSRSEIDPETRHAVTTMNASADLFPDDLHNFGDHVAVTTDTCREVAGGDLNVLVRTMTAQALSLDALFTQMQRRAAMNMRDYPDAFDRYMRLGLKAQAQSRSTIETLAKILQPREQTVRHVHVGPDGQAVFIENMHGGMGNARYDEQPHAQRASGPALLSQDTGGNGMPIPGGAGEEALSAPRRGSRKRRTAG